MKTLVLLLATLAGGTAIAAEGTKTQFNALADRFFEDAYFPYHSTQATSAGVHQYDNQLEDYSRQNIQSEIAIGKRYLAEFEKFEPRTLDPGQAIDRELLISRIRGSLLMLDEIRTWQKDPDLYSSGIANAVFVILSRKFAPAADRLRSVIARERRMPEVFSAARENLSNPPRISTGIALEQLPGIISFFQKDVPEAFNGVADPRLLSEFRETNGRVLSALAGYQAFLKNELLARSNGDFRIGAEFYRRKLLYDEMVDVPLDRLLAVGYEDLRRNQDAFRRTASQLDPKRAPRQILEELEKDHPAPDHLLEAFRNVLGGLRDFITGHKIVDIPSPVPPILEETPPFMRALTFASMDTPGPFEKVAKEAFFNVTLPEPAWSREQVEEHMAAFNRGTIISTAIHEAYPGHYVQFLWMERAPSKTRKLLGCGSNAEGWAHYTEQMMLDEGYGNGDLKLRLGQLQDALLRNARYIVGMEMHTGKMSYEQGVEFFVKEGFQTRANAERETKRGTSDPTYLVYTLGKLEIMKLREDYRKARGANFRLSEFHDRFLAEGYPPIRLVRRALVGNDGPVL